MCLGGGVQVAMGARGIGAPGDGGRGSCESLIWVMGFEFRSSARALF